MLLVLVDLHLVLAVQLLPTQLAGEVAHACVARQVLLVVVDGHKAALAVRARVAELALVSVLVVPQPLLRAERLATKLAR